MSSRTQTRSLTEEAYASLRAGIVAGRFGPGQRLRPTELAAAQGVSLNVVREALSRLAGERLVVALPQLGFTVAEASVEDLYDLTQVRVLIETEAIRRSIDLGDLAWESGLVAAHHLLAGTPMLLPGGDDLSDEWMHAHNAFHAATMSGCGSPRLIELAAGLGESAAIYRHLSLRHDHGTRDIAGEHRAIFEATLARDADLATRLHTAHIRHTADIVAAALAAQQ